MLTNPCNTSVCGQNEGTSGWAIPLIVVPIRPASSASSRFISSTGCIASHFANSVLMSAILLLDSTQNAAAAAFCSAAWASIAGLIKIQFLYPLKHKLPARAP